jgi:chemotaxis protein MotB
MNHAEQDTLVSPSATSSVEHPEATLSDAEHSLNATLVAQPATEHDVEPSAMQTEGGLPELDAHEAESIAAEEHHEEEHEHSTHSDGHGGHGGHRKKHHAPEGAGPGAPLWMLSFADMMTNLLTFFILMAAYTKSSMGIQFEDFIGTIKQDLSDVQLSGSGMGHDAAFQFGAGRVIYRAANPVNNETLVEATGGLTDLNRDRLRQILLEQMQLGGWRTLPTPVLFEPASSQLTPGQVKLLEQLGSMMASGRWPVRVDGYSFAEGQSEDEGWDIASARATAAARVLESAGVDRSRLQVAGHGMLLQGRWSGTDGAHLPQNKYGRRAVLITLGEEH